VLKDGVQKEELTVIPYELQLDYNYWAYRKNEHKPTTPALLCSFCLLNSTRLQEK
jgi:tRNA (guanine37-N1)-methyltransferase